MVGRATFTALSCVLSVALASSCGGESSIKHPGTGGSASGFAGEAGGGTPGGGTGASNSSGGAGTGASSGRGGASSAGSPASAGGAAGADAGAAGEGGSSSGDAGFGGEGGSQTSGEAGGGAGGTTAGSPASEAGEGGAGGSDEPREFPPRPLCGTLYEPNHSWCEGIENVELIVSPLVDAGGDGGLSPGEEATVVVTMHNLSKATFRSPCVGLLADHPEVTIIGDDGRNPVVNWFGIGGRGRIDQKMSFRAEPAIAPGTRVRFTTWFDVQTAGCTNGNSVEFELVID